MENSAQRTQTMIVHEGLTGGGQLFEEIIWLEIQALIDLLLDPESALDYIRINARNFISAADTPGYDSDLNETVNVSRNGANQRGATVTLKYINFESD
jgi:hypothetical protein